MSGTALALALSVAPITASAKAAVPSLHEVSVGAGSPYGLLPPCRYLLGAPCGVPLSLGARYQYRAFQGPLGRSRQAVRLGAEADVVWLAPLRANDAGAVGGLIAVTGRWGVALGGPVELELGLELGAHVLPGAYQPALLFVNPTVGVRAALGSRGFLSVEAGPFDARLAVGMSWL